MLENADEGETPKLCIMTVISKKTPKFFRSCSNYEIIRHLCPFIMASSPKFIKEHNFMSFLYLCYQCFLFFFFAFRLLYTPEAHASDNTKGFKPLSKKHHVIYEKLGMCWLSFLSPFLCNWDTGHFSLHVKNDNAHPRHVLSCAAFGSMRFRGSSYLPGFLAPCSSFTSPCS